ncbi:MAG TPA: outer membrane beta-barrel protein [Legionellaceae bacterium]|nr:outer membrane beta-barrel protein [Legionellaceae bacterium]
MFKKLWMISFFIIFSSCHAATVQTLQKQLIVSPLESPWQLELGPRYWYSTAHYRENLLGDPGIIVSRLSYEDLNADSAEGFWKLKHHNGVYIKGYVGGGTIGNGQLIDEDFPPGITPYSRTFSPQKNGTLNYLSLDLGYDLFSSSIGRLGGFVGYHYWQEEVNNYGCTQTADGPICVMPIALSDDTLNNTATWNSLRLGINGEMHLSEAWHLETDLAYIHSALQEFDYHNLRPNIRGILDTGPGNGCQLDALLKYALSDEFHLGIGGRWWYLVTNGLAHFEQVAVAGQPQPMDGIQNRYGLLVQANYQFVDKPKTKQAHLAWQGLYLGVHIGYGTEPSLVDIYAMSETADILQSNALSPFSLNIQNAGFLGGGQLGYNWQSGAIILSAEADLDDTQIGGANAVTSNMSLTTTVNQNIQWLSSIRGRVGKLASPDILVYLTAGPAWGGVTLAFDQSNVTDTCAAGLVCISTTQNSTELGWTAGGGIEYTVNPYVNFKAEYLYVNLGSPNYDASGIGTLGQTDYLLNTDFIANTMRLGINYKIDKS